MTALQLRFAARLADAQADESWQRPSPQLEDSFSPQDAGTLDGNNAASGSATTGRRVADQQSGLPWTVADEPGEVFAGPSLNSSKTADGERPASTGPTQQQQQRLTMPTLPDASTMEQQGQQRNSPASSSMQVSSAQGPSISQPRSDGEPQVENDLLWTPESADAAAGLSPEEPATMSEHLSPWEQYRAGSEAISASPPLAAGSSVGDPPQAFLDSGYPSNGLASGGSDPQDSTSSIRDPWGQSSTEGNRQRGLQQGGAGETWRSDVQAGKRLLAEGRAKRREPRAWGEADQALAGACASFRAATKASPDQASILVRAELYWHAPACNHGSPHSYVYGVVINPSDMPGCCSGDFGIRPGARVICMLCC